MRALKVLVVAMGVLIIGGTATLLTMLVQRTTMAGGGARVELGLGQPEGARIAGIAATEGGLAIWVARPDGDRVLVVDGKRNRVSGEIRLGQ